jgi:hypothetical protein
MTMLTHTHGPIERSSYSPPQERNAARADATSTRLAAIKRLCLCVCAALLAVAAIIALRTAVYLARFNYH